MRKYLVFSIWKCVSRDSRMPDNSLEFDLSVFGLLVDSGDGKGEVKQVMVE